MIRIAIVEDTKEDASKLRRHLNRYAEENNQQISIKVFENGSVFLTEYSPVYDVVFMDIVMPLIDGLTVAQKLRMKDESVPLVFVTDMAQYALEGYKVNAMDFFVKPITYFDLKLRMDRISKLLQRKSASVAIRMSGKGTAAVDSRDICYIEVIDKEMIYHTTAGTFTTRSNGLKKLASDLERFNFVRCSSSYLVNLHWVTRLSDDTVTVAGDCLKISRGQKKEFLSKLSSFWGGNEV